ncbi:hypothetical protein LCGC14_2775730, partial [marine sediment metagenome]
VLSKQLVMPSQYTGSGLKLVHGFFKTETVTAETATLDVHIEAVTPNSDTLDMETAESFSTVNVVDMIPPTTVGNPTDSSKTLTNADSIAAGDSFRIGIRRDTIATSPTADDATGDFCLYAVEIADDA